MKRRGYILLSAALLIAFTSCDTSKNNPEIVNEGDNIDFVATQFHEPFIQANQARGSEAGNDAIQTFGVYAYYAADAFSTELTPNFMCNTRVKKESNGSWAYEPLVYWPNGGTLSFFAYSPYAETGDSYTVLSSTATTPGYPQLTYTVPDKVADQRDLLVSVPLIDQIKSSVNSDGKLPLMFKHTLSCLVFKAKMTAACDFPVRVTSIALGAFKNKAALSYVDTRGTFSWAEDADAADKSYSFGIGSGLEDTDLKSITDDYQSITSDDSRLMLLPQDIDENDMITVTVEYNTESSPHVRNVTVSLYSLIKTLAVGKRYSISILVSALADVTLTCEVDPWTPKIVNVPNFK